MNADGQMAGVGGDVVGVNLYAYCGNNPINRFDPAGDAWWHWAIGAAVVVACAVAVVATAGGAAAGIAAVAMVANGVTAATTATTIAAATFIGSATAFGMAALTAASTSTSAEDFCEQGSWVTVAEVVGSGVLAGGLTYFSSKSVSSKVSSGETFLPDSYYENKKAPKYNTPDSNYINYRYNSFTEKYESSTAYYDYAGRQIIRIDWTNHGYSSHGNPHIHYTQYGVGFEGGKIIRWD